MNKDKQDTTRQTYFRDDAGNDTPIAPLESPWVSVEDRLPEKGKYTHRLLLAVWYKLAVPDKSVSLQFGEYDGYCEAFYWAKGEYREDEHFKVLAWMETDGIPLPNPPEPTREVK